MNNQVLIGDCAEVLKSFPDECIDAVITDPPYGISFMGKEWDKALPSLEALKECNRVLKSGAFGFFMCSPRMDVLWRMGQRLEEAGFRVDFSFIGWSFASGFPKAAAIDKLIDKRNGRNQETYKPFADYLKQKRIEKNLSMSEIDRILGTNTAYSWWEGRLSGIQLPSKFYYLQLKELLDLDSRFDELIEREEAEREVISTKRVQRNSASWNTKTGMLAVGEQNFDITAPATDKAKEFEGSFAGCNLKPALEVIITVMKNLDSKTYVDQALANGKGCTWLSDCRIPYENENDVPQKVVDYTNKGIPHAENDGGRPWINDRIENGLPVKEYNPNSDGRFPANLLVSDNILDRGIITKYQGGPANPEKSNSTDIYKFTDHKRGFHPGDSGDFSRYFSLDAWWAKKISELPEEQQKTFPFLITPKPSKSEKNRYIENKHPTVKPLKLMSYLITMGSREGDVILDPYAGSGTTLEACRLLNRSFIGIDKDPENEKYMKARGQIDTPTLDDFEEVSA